MTSAPSLGDGLIVVRAWLEDGDRSRFRARVIAVPDLAREGNAATRAAASVDEACELVRQALQAYVDGDEPPGFEPASLPGRP
jgi:hypothetical protein